MCVHLITRLLRGVGRWARKPVNHTSWVTVVTPTDRPKSVRNCCLIERFCGVVCVVTLPLWHFCWYRGFCHRTGSDLLLFVFSTWVHKTRYDNLISIMTLIVKLARFNKIIETFIKIRCCQLVFRLLARHTGCLYCIKCSLLCFQLLRENITIPSIIENVIPIICNWC